MSSGPRFPGASARSHPQRCRRSRGKLPPVEPAADRTPDPSTPLSHWHNAAVPCDVNGVDGVTPLDALLIVNYLNAYPADIIAGPRRCRSSLLGRERRRGRHAPRRPVGDEFPGTYQARDGRGRRRDRCAARGRGVGGPGKAWHDGDGQPADIGSGPSTPRLGLLRQGPSGRRSGPHLRAIPAQSERRETGTDDLELALAAVSPTSTRC